ncbi:MAG: TRAP transporter substrate-binding protein DctP [Sphingomonadaceae bacterium]|nr:TRAP transporter substrate-binding protein DctP [Sphingomonadaceae bacterium]
MNRREAISIIGGGLLLAGCGTSALNRATKVGMSTPADVVNNGVYAWIEACVEILRGAGWETRIYPNSAVGGERDRIYQSQLGLLEINETGGDEIGRWSPMAHASGRPFLIDSYDHMSRILSDTPFLSRISHELAPYGLQLVDMAYTGSMVGLFTRGTPVRRLADLRKLRLRVLSAADFHLLNAWRVNGVQVAWEEVAQALQSGMVDAYLNPPNVAPMFGHGTVLDYFTDLRMGPAARLIVVSTKWLNGLDALERATLERSFAAGRAANRRWISASQARDRQKLAEVGIEWIDLTVEERAEWLAACAAIPPDAWDRPDATAQYNRWIEETRGTS